MHNFTIPRAEKSIQLNLLSQFRMIYQFEHFMLLLEIKRNQTRVDFGHGIEDSRGNVEMVGGLAKKLEHYTRNTIGFTTTTNRRRKRREKRKSLYKINKN